MYTLSCAQVIYLLPTLHSFSFYILIIENAFEPHHSYANLLVYPAWVLLKVPVKNIHKESPKVSKPGFPKIPKKHSFFHGKKPPDPTDRHLRPLDPRDSQLAIWGILQSLDSGECYVATGKHTGAAFWDRKVSSSKRTEWKEMFFFCGVWCLFGFFKDFRLAENHWLLNEDP